MKDHTKQLKICKLQNNIKAYQSKVAHLSKELDELKKTPKSMDDFAYTTSELIGDFLIDHPFKHRKNLFVRPTVLSFGPDCQLAVLGSDDDAKELSAKLLDHLEEYGVTGYPLTRTVLRDFILDDFKEHVTKFRDRTN
jgi:hypothetical protein